MSFSRFLKMALIPGYNLFDITKKILERGFTGGIKEKLQEEMEDIPVISHVYNAGKYQGKKDGYNEASHVYEDKLLKQAEVFLAQTKDFESQKQDFEQLIDDYEKYIDEMSARDDLSVVENEYLHRIMLMERKLKKAV